jgi:pimeloyl-ACP methyl ester carboxylesterase
MTMVAADPVLAPVARKRASVRAPVWFRGAMGTLSRAAPPVAAAVAERIFMTPPKRPLKSSEHAAASAARAFTLDTPAGALRAWRWGTAAETVLLVHGWGGRGPQLGQVARALVERGYSALAWDMPGHGDRSTPTSLPEMAGVTAAVARRAGPLAGVVVHSFGMATALSATLHGFSPARLVGVAPAAVLHRITGQFAHMTGFSSSVVERMRTRVSTRLGFAWDDLEAATLAPRLDCPALLIHDQDDDRIPIADGIELAGLLPRAEIVTTSGLGHTGPLVDPGVLARIAGFFPAP